MSGQGLQVRDLRVGYDRGPEVVRGIDLLAPRGSVTALIGPNGAGKSTLLKAIVGLLPHGGQAILDGDDLARLPARERARRLAYVPQRTLLMARLSVREVVALGRFAHRASAWTFGHGKADRVAIEAALEETDTRAFAERPFPELSGGEQQRVLLARALATGATTLLLDEPTSALDVHHVLVLHGILRRLSERGHCVVAVLHHLSEVRRHAHRVVLLNGGQVHMEGPAAEVVAPGPIRAVYGVVARESTGLSFELPSETAS